MLGLGGAALSFGPTRRAIMARGWLPEPGKGPSRAKMLRGRYAMTFVASSPTSGAGATATTWTGAGDASCIHTTIFLCEASSVFSFEVFSMTEISFENEISVRNREISTTLKYYR